MMLVIGLLSMMFAAGMYDVITLFAGSTINELGATPKLHCSKAPMQTCFGIDELPISDEG